LSQKESDVSSEKLKAARWDGLLLTATVILAILASLPFVEMGQIDDFSYVKTTFDFARTGHLLYNGWATAMLGWQVVWGALFVKLFGYTYAATRLSTLTVAAGCVWLTHSICLRCGVNRRNAIFGTLTVCLSPLFVPLSVTFMTDVSGLFVILVCLYCCLRALDARSDRMVVMWVVVASLTGAVGGTARQIAWLAPLVMVPSAVWVLRRRRGVVLVGLIGELITVAVILACMRWFKTQPYSVPEVLIPEMWSLRELAGHFWAAFLCLSFLLLPVLVASFAWVRTIPGKTLAWMAMFLPVALIMSMLVTWHGPLKGMMPWSGDVIIRLGIFDYRNAWFIGISPMTFSFAGRVAVSAVVFAALFVFLYIILRKQASGSEDAGGISWHSLTILFAPFLVAYLALLAPRGLWADIIDRYLLPLLVLAVVVLLRLYQERVEARLPLVSYVMLGLFVFLSVAGTHDWIAMYKARVLAINRLHDGGVTSSQIQAGFEADGAIQIANAGVIIDKRVPTPPGIERVRYRPANLPDDCVELFNEHTPTIHAEYFLAYQVVPCLTTSQFGSITYSTWMPPFTRKILILKLQ
jgi:hypothetical protein